MTVMPIFLVNPIRQFSIKLKNQLIIFLNSEFPLCYLFFEAIKKLNLCHKLKFSIPYILQPDSVNLSYFKPSFLSSNMKNSQFEISRFTKLGCNDMGLENQSLWQTTNSFNTCLQGKFSIFLILNSSQSHFNFSHFSVQNFILFFYLFLILLDFYFYFYF